jgi:hypothetical protein
LSLAILVIIILFELTYTGGSISTLLHKIKNQEMEIVQPYLRGIGGSFTCFQRNTSNELELISNNLLFIVGGIGITPFMRFVF